MYKYTPPETERPLLVIQHGGECRLMLYVVIGLIIGSEIHYHLGCVVAVATVRRIGI